MLKLNRLVLIGLAALICYTIVALSSWPQTLFWGFDGDAFIRCIRQIEQYAASPIDHSVISPLHGMGGLISPNAIWIHLALLPFCFENLPFDARIASYFVAIVLAALSTYCLGRAVDLSRIVALVGAQVMAVLFFSAGIVACGALLSSANFRMLGFRLLGLALCLAVLLACNVHNYYRGILRSTEHQDCKLSPYICTADTAVARGFETASFRLALLMQFFRLKPTAQNDSMDLSASLPHRHPSRHWQNQLIIGTSHLFDVCFPFSKRRAILPR